MRPPEVRQLRIGGLRVDHLLAAQLEHKNPIVFVRGFWYNSSLFHDWVISAAKAGYDAYVPHLRLADSVADYTDQLLRVVNHLGPVNIIGHSMGGLLVQRTAMENANVRRIVLASTVPPVGPFIRPVRFSAVAVYIPALWKGVKFCLADKHIDLLLANCVSPAFFSDFRSSFGHESGKVGWELLTSWRRVPRLSLPCPSLVVAVTKDQFMTLGSQRRTASVYQSDYIEVDSGHMLMLGRESERTISQILRWLDS